MNKILFFVLKCAASNTPVGIPIITGDSANVPKKPNLFQRFITPRLAVKLANSQAGLFYMLQKRFPVIKIGLLKIAVVSRHDLVVDVLERNNDFTVEEINAKKMSNQKGAFFLGMDRSNPLFDRERNFVRKSTHKDDLDLMRQTIEDPYTMGENHKRIESTITSTYKEIEVLPSLALALVTKSILLY